MLMRMSGSGGGREQFVAALLRGHVGNDRLNRRADCRSSCAVLCSVAGIDAVDDDAHPFARQSLSTRFAEPPR